MAGLLRGHASLNPPAAPVGVLLLAAGRSRRFGSDKRFATLPDGRGLMESTLDAIEASGLPLLACVAPADEEGKGLLQSRGCTALECDRAGEGMGSVLAQGMLGLPAWEGVLVALADMPWIHPDSYAAVAAGLSGPRIHRPFHAGRPGNPVGFGADYFKELAELSGEDGGKPLLKRHADRVVRIDLEDAGILEDVDTPAQLPGR